MKIWRKLAQLQLLLFLQGEARPLPSCTLSLLHLYLRPQLLLHPCHQLLVSVAATVAQEQDPAVTSGQLPTKPPWQRQPSVLAHLLAFIPHHLLNPGGAM